MAKQPTDAAKKPQHKATYASDKYNPGQYNIRIVGPHAAKFRPGREIPVTKKDNTENIETLGKCFWAGTDEETRQPVALYHFESKPRSVEEDDEIPF